MLNGSIKSLKFKYEVLQLNISNFKSTRLANMKKDKTCQTWDAMLDNQPLNGPSNYKMNSDNELISQESRRVKLMGFFQHLKGHANRILKN